MPVLDPFGIREIYPTNTHPNRAKPWYMGIGNWSDRRFTGTFAGAVGDWNDCPINSENPYEINFDTGLIGKKGRLPVLPQPLDDYPRDWPDPPFVVVWHTQSVLRKRGYMGYLNDWKHVEVTLYFKIIRWPDSDDFKAMAISARGGPHHDHDCKGTALYVQLDLDGIAHITKELGNSDYVPEDKNSGQSVVDPKNHWIGMKGVFYTKANGNPYIELWLDRDPLHNLNNWERILSKEDMGGWALAHSNGCDGAADEKITWGGPGVIFKIANLKKLDLKWLSVREILPPEGWPLRYLLNARDVPFPVSMRSLAQEHGLSAPISLRDLTQREAELNPFP